MTLNSYLLKDCMRKLTEQGSAIFFSTHVLEVAEKLCDRVIIIKKGHLLYDGTLDELENKNKNGSLEEIFLELTGNDKKEKELSE